MRDLNTHKIPYKDNKSYSCFNRVINTILTGFTTSNNIELKGLYKPPNKITCNESKNKYIYNNANSSIIKDKNNTISNIIKSLKTKWKVKKKGELDVKRLEDTISIRLPKEKELKLIHYLDNSKFIE